MEQKCQFGLFGLYAEVKPKKCAGVRLNTLLLVLMILVSNSYAQMKECRCHSRQPAMKHMHETIGFTGCGNCHSKDENLMSPGGKADPKRKERLASRIQTDKFCIPCHDSHGAVKKDILSSQEAMSITGTLFCPKDKLRFEPGMVSCSKCGGPLIDINQIMEISRKSPSNEICIRCHAIEEVRQIERHTIFNSTKLKECLDCHQGHDDCGACHH